MTAETVTLTGEHAGVLCTLVEQTALAHTTERQDDWTETRFVALYPVAAWSSGEQALWNLLVGLAEGRVDLTALEDVRFRADAQNLAVVERAVAKVTGVSA